MSYFGSNNEQITTSPNMKKPSGFSTSSEPQKSLQNQAQTPAPKPVPKPADAPAQSRPISAPKTEPTFSSQTAAQNLVPASKTKPQNQEPILEPKSASKSKLSRPQDIQSEIEKHQAEIRALKRSLKTSAKRREKEVLPLIAKTFISETKIDIYLTDDEIKKLVKSICRSGLKNSAD